MRSCGKGWRTLPYAECLAHDDIAGLQKIAARDEPVIIYCHNGMCPWSYDLAKAAVAVGYTKVFWYRGGIDA